MPSCGSQCLICDVPIRLDTYVGCTHACKYCFAQRKRDNDIIKGAENCKNLIDFIQGKRNPMTNWCDWNIPLHIGGMSDPFQPAERKYQRTLECLKVLAETKYPVIISTKGSICIEEPYLSLLKKCNVVMQISMACSKYDKLEPGAPTYKERLEILSVLSSNVRRTIVRCQPYLHECFRDIKNEIPNYAKAGAYGVIFEGMKFQRKVPGAVKVAGDLCYPLNILTSDFQVLKTLCHDNGLKFYSGENRLRTMGDSLTCCGIDGLEDFVPNKYNLNHLLNGDKTNPNASQTQQGTAGCFCAIHQNTVYQKWAKDKSYQQAMIKDLKDSNVWYEVFNKKA